MCLFCRRYTVGHNCNILFVELISERDAYVLEHVTPKYVKKQRIFERKVNMRLFQRLRQGCPTFLQRLPCLVGER